jgi:hypothetical protein
MVSSGSGLRAIHTKRQAGDRSKWMQRRCLQCNSNPSRGKVPIAIHTALSAKDRGASLYQRSGNYWGLNLTGHLLATREASHPATGVT